MRISKFLRAITNIIDSIEEKLIVVIFSVAVIVGIMQVMARFVFKAPLPWSEELMRFCFVWLTFLAASLGMSRETHISVDILIKKIPPSFNKMARAYIKVLSLLFVVTALILSSNLVYQSISTGQISAAMEIPLYIPYSGLVISFFFMLIQVSNKLVDLLYPNSNS